MALVVKDRVRETSTTQGTGTFTLAGAVTGYQSFSAIGNGNTTYYTIYLQASNEWEVGIGTYTASGTTLSRDTILASSNGGAVVNFSAGTKDVFVTYPADRSVYYDTATNVTVNQLSATTVDTTNIEVTNIKAKDGTAALSIADSTGVVSVSANPVLSGGTANGVVYLNASKVATSGSALTFDGTNLGVGTSSPVTKLDVRATSFTPTSSASSVLIEDKSTWAQGLQFYLNNAGTFFSSRPSGALGASNTVGLILSAGSFVTGDPDVSSGFTATHTSASIYRPSGGVHIWYANTGLTAGNTFTANEQMRLTSTGLGIGTTNPINKLVVSNGGAAGLEVVPGEANGPTIYSYNRNTSAWTTLQTFASQQIFCANGTTEAMRLTSGGQLNLGGNFTSTNNTLQVTGNAAIGYTTAAPTTGLIVAGNVGIGTDSPQRRIHGYIATGPVARMQTNGSNAAIEYVPGATDGTGSIYNWVVGAQYNIGNAFEITPSTAAGNLTFTNAVYSVSNAGLHKWYNGTTQAMTLDASGNLLVGTPNQAPLVGAGKYFTLYNSGNTTLSVQAVDGVNDRNATLELLSSGNGASISQIVYGDTDTTPTTASPLVFAGYHNGTRTERARITSGGQFAMTNDGTNAAPAISFTNDLDTGIFRPTTNQLGFATAGVQAMTLDASGNLLVGLTSALTNGKLQIAGGIGLSGNTQIRQATNADGNTLQLFATQVVVGTSNAQSYDYSGGGLLASVSTSAAAVLLDVGGATAGQRLKVINDGTGSQGYLDYSDAGTSRFYVNSATGNVGIGTSSPKIQEWRSGTYLTVANASTRGQVEIDGAVADSSSASLGALIFTYSTNTTNHKDVALIEATSSGATANQRGGVLNFYTKANGTAAPALNMTLDSSGNLGLGVTPSAWGSYATYGIRSFELGAYGAVENLNAIGGVNVVSNAYNNGINYIYKQSYYASKYTQGAGQHQWYTAPSGTANTTTITNGVSYTIITSGNQTAFGAANNNVGTVFTANASGTLSSGTVSQNISFNQAMTLDASGNLGIGATSPGYKLDVQGTTPAIRLKTAGVGTGFKIEQSNATGDVELNVIDGYPLIFKTTNAERARITSGGYFKASNDGTYYGSTFSYHELRTSATNDTAVISNTHASSPYGVFLAFTAASPDNNTNYFLKCDDSTATRCYIYSDGDLANHDGVYGTISDQKLKQDIVDAGSQWDDIKAIRFRKYRMKSDVAANPDSPALLGVIAQELEQVSPGLVDEHPDMETVEVTDEDGNVTQTQQPTGTTTKTVKSSILLMKAAVALQEAMARIEKLEAEVAALKGV